MGFRKRQISQRYIFLRKASWSVDQPELTATLSSFLVDRMADEDLSLNEDQLLDSLDDANGDSELMQDVS